MPRVKLVDGIRMPLTAEEETARDAEELAWANAKPMNKWLDDIAGTDGGMPRYLEDLITDNPSLTIHEKIKIRYDEKVALRATKPKE